jgi:hypothetical protein
MLEEWLIPRDGSTILQIMRCQTGYYCFMNKSMFSSPGLDEGENTIKALVNSQREMVMEVSDRLSDANLRTSIQHRHTDSWHGGGGGWGEWGAGVPSLDPSLF